MEAEVIGKLNILAGWLFIVMGITTGSILGMWSFAGPCKTPPGHHNYTDLPRRLTRLGHIACFALPIICILYGMHIDAVPLSQTLKYWGSICMIVCMVGVPSLLFLAAIWLPFKYVEVIPVSSGFVAFLIMAYGQVKLYWS